MFVVTETSDRLVSPSERGPGQTLEKRHGSADQQGKEEPSHFRHAQRNHYRTVSPRMRLNSSSVLEGECGWEDFSWFFSSSASESGRSAWLWARNTVRKACASRHSVMWQTASAAPRSFFSLG